MSMYTRITLQGVNLDVDPIDLPPDVWTEATNMVPEPGSMARANGYREVFPTPLFPPYYLQYTPQLNEPYWLYAGRTNIAVIDPAAAHSDITPGGTLPAVPENGWSGGNLSGLAVVNSAETGPYYWFNGIGPEALTLPGQRPNTRYRVMRPFKYHLVGMVVIGESSEIPDELHWSDASDPGQIPATWVPAADNEAGDNILADENGAIIDGMSLRDSFFIYKQDSVYEMTYVGGNSVMRFRKVFGTVGILTQNCVVRVKGTHIVLGNGDIYQHDGQNIKSLADGVIRDTFFATIDDTYYRNSFAVYLEAKEEVWFCVPTTGSERPNLALVYSVDTGTFGYRQLPDADFAATGIIAVDGTAPVEDWDTDAQAWNEDTTSWLNQTLSVTEDAILIADADGEKLYQGDTGTTADGVGYGSSVGRLGLDLQDPQREKAIRRIWPRINAPADAAFTLELFNQRDPMAGQEVVGSYNFVPGTEGVAVNVNARYLGMRISTEDNVAWSLGGVDIEYLPRGGF